VFVYDKNSLLLRFITDVMASVMRACPRFSLGNRTGYLAVELSKQGVVGALPSNNYPFRPRQDRDRILAETFIA